MLSNVKAIKAKKWNTNLLSTVASHLIFRFLVDVRLMLNDPLNDN